VELAVRAVTFQSGELTLEGVLHTPDGAAAPLPGLVVCHPHPQYGGDMRNNVVHALCRAAVARGIAALRFNFRGVGASQGAYDRARGEADDARAALAFLREQPEIDAERVGLAGYSFGAVVAAGLAVGQPGTDVQALIAVSTPTSMVDLGPVYGTPPALFISGDRDEYSDPLRLAEIVAALGPQAELVVLPGVDHFWWGSDDRLMEAVSGFLGRTLAPRTSTRTP
jgi:hypothetical protein